MDQVITADDVVRAGACHAGVMAVVKRLSGKIAAAMPVSALMKLLKPDERPYLVKAAGLDGNGNGDGYGNGYGEGGAG